MDKKRKRRKMMSIPNRNGMRKKMDQKKRKIGNGGIDEDIWEGEERKRRRDRWEEGREGRV